MLFLSRKFGPVDLVTLQHIFRGILNLGTCFRPGAWGIHNPNLSIAFSRRKKSADNGRSCPKAVETSSDLGVRSRPFWRGANSGLADLSVVSESLYFQLLSTEAMPLPQLAKRRCKLLPVL
jgi:hypothetical protein